MNIGKVSESVLKRSVLKYVQQNSKSIDNTCHLIQGAKVGADCALFAVSEGGTSRMGSATAAAIGRHRMVVVEAMINACTNLICGGVEAFGVELSLVLPEAVYESELRHMMEEAEQFAEDHHITILGGHTTVSPFVTETIATVTALGKGCGFKAKSMKPGMDVVMSKWIGLQGTAKIAEARKEELEKRLPPRMIAEAVKYSHYMSIVSEARVAMGADVCAMHDVSGGGIFRALWELAEAAQTGIGIDLKKIPIKQETIEICEVFGLNPYELLSGGALLMVTEDGEALAEKLAETGISAAVIGRLTDDNNRVLVTHTEDGDETRFLERPKTDEIDKM